MRKLITKGEISDMLGLTKSQVRFYEKKGLIKPHVDKNGYSMYSFNELDALELVILLKELDTPIKEIKKIIDDEAAYDYPALLRQSYDNINLEIERLNKRKNIIAQRLRAFNNDELNSFKTEYYSERLLYLMKDEHLVDSIKNVNDLMKEHNLRYLDYDNELYAITKDGQERIGFVNLKGQLINTTITKESLPEGRYFSYIISYSYDEDFSIYETEFRREAKKRNIDIEDEIIFIDHFGRKFYEKHRVVGTLQSKIIE